MKKFLMFIMAVVFYGYGFAQVANPVQWNFSAKKIGPATYEIHLFAKMDEDWHIYSQTTPDGGPVPTSISFLKNPLVTLVGSAKEVGKLEKQFEPLFGVEVKQFSDKVDFVQTVTVKEKIKTALNGTVQFMTCNNEQCLPPTTVKFSIPLNK